MKIFPLCIIFDPYSYIVDQIDALPPYPKTSFRAPTYQLMYGPSTANDTRRCSFNTAPYLQNGLFHTSKQYGRSFKDFSSVYYRAVSYICIFRRDHTWIPLDKSSLPQLRQRMAVDGSIASIWDITLTPNASLKHHNL